MLSLAAALYLLAFLFAFIEWVRTPKSYKPTKIVLTAWFIVYVGQGQIFGASESGLGMGAYYQMAWMFIGTFVIVLGLTKYWEKPLPGGMIIFFLFAYSCVGYLSAWVSPSPLLSIYKSSQILMDCLLMCLAISILVHDDRPFRLFDFSIFLTTMVLLSTAICGVLFPDRAFKSIYAAYTGVLNSLYPQVHANELGLLAAVVLVVSISRIFNPTYTVLKRFYWVSSTCLSGTVLFYAQARTSLTLGFLCLTILAFYTKKMRMIYFAFATLLICGIVIGGLNLEGSTVEVYLRRGASNEQIASLTGRVGLWKNGFKMFLDAPLLGHGMDAGVRYGGAKYGVPLGTNMHSAHMQVLVNTGILGYICWFPFVASIFLMSLRLFLRSRKTLPLRIWRLCLEGFLIVFLICARSLVGHVLVTHHFSFLIFMSIFISLVSYFNSKANVNTDMGG